MAVLLFSATVGLKPVDARIGALTVPVYFVSQVEERLAKPFQF